MTCTKRRDFACLMSRARAALETPSDLSAEDREALIEALAAAEDSLRLHPLPWAIDIHVAHIDHSAGANLYAAVGRETLMREIAEFCREYWSEIADDRDPDTLDDEEIARIYFELHPDEYLQTDRVAIDAPPATLVTGEQS